MSLLLKRVLDFVEEKHEGPLEGAKALRSALRQQDLTRRYGPIPPQFVKTYSCVEDQQCRLMPSRSAPLPTS